MQDQETQKNPLTENKSEAIEQSQANTQSEVREGQEDSSILHDNKQEENELPRDVTKKDISSTSQEEFIEDKNVTRKETD